MDAKTQIHTRWIATRSHPQPGALHAGVTGNLQMAVAEGSARVTIAPDVGNAHTKVLHNALAMEVLSPLRGRGALRSIQFMGLIDGKGKSRRKWNRGFISTYLIA